jgi:ABC-type branched-subunit amino acid transport system ATPase component
MVLFSGSDLGSEPPHMRAKAGVSRTWQGGELFEDLSVGDNVRAALEQRDKPRLLGDLLRFDRRPLRDRVLEILTAVGLSGEVDSLPRWLPHGKRKLVGVARAMAADAKLIFLDEPAAGLSTLETDSLAECLHRIRRTGIGLLLVEHDIRLVDGICERVYVLDRGTILASGTPAEVLRDERVVAAYLGNTAVGLRDRDELGAR